MMQPARQNRKAHAHHRWQNVCEKANCVNTEQAKPQNNPVPPEEKATFANAPTGPDVDGGRRAGGPVHHDHDPSSARRNQRLRLEQTRSTAPSRSQVPCHSRFQAGLDRRTPRTDS
ncbi:hypothetical protein M9458_054232 [Cirrhinus mrigala]|uniref:Uncharacterized protein n=1 Tax=Cirrhinus mrigala TaxID=683832 RepID=A0ABD0ML86_CIRMR